VKDSKRSRLGVIVVTGLLLIGFPTIQYAVGSNRANTEMTRIRNKAPHLNIDRGQLAAAAYQRGGDDPVALALGIQDRQISLSTSGTQWCIGIEIRRLLATRQLTFVLTNGGALAEVQTCP
jgi:hypothetical protein